MEHLKAMYRVMAYCISTSKRGNKIKPNKRWNGSPEFEFTIAERADPDYAQDLETMCKWDYDFSMWSSNNLEIKNDAYSGIICDRSWIICSSDGSTRYAIHYESMGVGVKKPMVSEIDNKGATDLVNNWSVGGRLRHVEFKQFFLWELKEQGLIVVKWLASEDNTAHLMTKNLGGQDFVHHTMTVCGNDEYVAYK
jgi:hypothetical protein